MRLLLQRVTQAAVAVDGAVIGQIGKGYVLLLCVMKGDAEAQADWLAEKVAGLRLFDGEDGKINDRSLLDVSGGALVVSQFTLSADVRKGRRPDYTAAADPTEAERLYTYFIQRLKNLGIQRVETGHFAAYMQVALTNDGPVTIPLEALP
jgi:D-tyrosyl-tRNA(Tyr) deacylase